MSEALPLELHKQRAPAARAALPWQYTAIVRELPGGWILLGEVGKYVPLSPARFTDASVRGGALDIAMVGAPREVVTVLVQKPSSTTLTAVTLMLGESGAAATTVAPTLHHTT